MPDYTAAHLTPLQALRLLQQEAGRGIEVMRNVRVLIDPGQLTAYVKLWIPQQLGTGTAPASARVEVPPAEAVGLDRGLPLILLSARPAGPFAKPDGDILFVRQGLPNGQLIEMARTLEGFASPCHVASLATPSGNLCLINVLNDKRRLSGAEGLKALGIFEGWDELSGYVYERLRVFLPANFRPGDELFRAFAAVLNHETAIGLLGISWQESGQERFYVVRASASEFAFEAVALPEFAFVDSIEVGIPAALNVEAVHARPGGDVRLLADILEGQAAGSGYRLRLRSSRFRPNLDLEQERLRMRRAEVDQRLAHLESVGRQRPFLLRFGQNRIEAMARAIYSFPVDALSEEEGQILYAFQASNRAPGGYHYLLINPGAVRHELDPVLLEDDHPPIRFWLDPSWSRYYPDAGNICYVFVPEHTALFPSLHSWYKADMDGHLRKIFEKRWSEQTGEGGLPETPYYIFDATPEGDQLDLTVLSASDFVPPRLRLGWISDHLTIARKHPIGNFVTDSADEVVWEHVCDAARQAAARARQSFSAAAGETRVRFAEEMNHLVVATTTQTNQTIEKVAKLVAEIQKLDTQLWQLVDIKNRKSGALQRLGDLTKGIEIEIKTFNDKLTNLQTAIVDALAKAGNIASEEKRQLQLFFSRLQSERDELELELRRQGKE